MTNITYRELLQTLKDYEGSPCDDILDQPITIRIDRGGVSQETHYVNNNDYDGSYILVAEVDLAADYGIDFAANMSGGTDHDSAVQMARDIQHYRCSDGHSPVTATEVLDRNRDERFIGHDLGWPLYLHD